MKKILCLIAVLAAMCAAVVPAHASSALSDALEYLSAVGISLEYEEETIQPDQRVTRASFAQLIVKLLNMTDLTCENVYYHDVSSDHWAFNQIGVLTENGIISGNEEKYFRPDDYITRNEAATIIVSVLGYRVYADSVGGYPAGYVKTATDIELFEDTSYSNDLTLSDALIMLKNSLDVKFLKRTLSGGEIAYIESEDETILSFYHNKYYAKGTLEGCDGITINSVNRIKDGRVIIDGFEYKSNLTDLLDDIGTKVEYIYEADEMNSDERQLVWVKSLGLNDVLDIQKDEYDSYDPVTSVFSYIPEGRETLKNIDISKGLVLIYNGAIATGDYDTILNSDKYKVRFIKSNTSSVYNIAIVWKYQNMVVGKVDLGEEIIYDKFDQTNNIDISQIREKIVVEGGMVLDQIAENDVLSIYESEDGTILKLEISKNIREVTAKYIGDEEEDRILFANDGEYIFFDNNANFSVLYGEQVKLYMDTKGYVVWVESVKINGFPVYLIKSSNYDDDELVLKVLDYTGEMKKYRITEKTRIDGSKKEIEDIHDILAPGNITIQQVIILELNEDGSIKSIDTSALGYGESDDNSLSKLKDNVYNWEKDANSNDDVKEENEDPYIHELISKHHGALYPSYILSPDAVIFNPPGNDVGNPSDSDYRVLKRSNLGNNVKYDHVEVYSYSKDTGYINLVVIKGVANTTLTNEKWVLVEKIKAAIDEESNVVEKLIGIQRGNAVEILTTTEYSLEDAGVKPGDIIALETNSIGKIKGFEKMFTYGSEFEPVYLPWLVSTDAPNVNRLGIGYVHSKIGNVLRLRFTKSDYEVAFEMPENVVVVYDQNEKDKVRKGTIWDLTPGSKVVYQTNDEQPVMMVVYK